MKPSFLTQELLPRKSPAILKIRKLQSITVITNALNVASELMDARGISVIMIGGLLRPVSGSFVGPQAETMLKNCMPTVCFSQWMVSIWRWAVDSRCIRSPTKWN